MEDKIMKIGIVGHGLSLPLMGSRAINLISHQIQNQQIFVVDMENEPSVFDPPSIPFINYHVPELQSISSSKINCKKGHTYINNICRCGKKI